MNQRDLQVRLATLGDLPAILAIYNHYVATSTCTFRIEPETAEEQLAAFRERGPRHPLTVAEMDGGVVGWGALSPWHSRCGYARSVEASVYVHPDHHRKGIGRAILLDLIERGRAAGHHTIIGSTCTEQTASIALQQSVGFQPAGCLREVGFKFGRWLDVVYMQLMLSPQERTAAGRW
jgi:phosphinothricin acetyltransferase